MAYHHKNRMIPEQTAIHLFRKIVTAVKLFNLKGRTFYTIDPTFIMIDEDLNPIFMDLSSNRQLNHA
jgi:hypothetical protein